MNLRAPFPWFGGKSLVADLVWRYFGDVPNYVEPFFGSGAVLWARPTSARTETVNDKDCYLANFWRAVQQDPEQVAYYADGPVNEADLHARHRWLVDQHDFRNRMMSDPFYFDARIAGWWVWGISQWIGSGWCSRPEWVGRTLPGRASRGVNSEKWKSRPNLTRTRDIGGSDKWQKRPAMRRGSPGVLRKEFQNGATSPRPSPPEAEREIGNKHPNFKRAAGSGVLRTEFVRPRRKRPLLLHSGAGVTKKSLRQLPQLSGDGSGNGRGVLLATISANLTEYMIELAERLRCVRVCCGDWKRIVGPSPTTCIGLTGIFLDPPYSEEADRDGSIYNCESVDVAHDVREWAIAHGHTPKLRIALCGYEGEHAMPADWVCVPWRANGGYGNQAHSRGRANAGRERIWFSPYCLKGAGGTV